MMIPMEQEINILKPKRAKEVIWRTDGPNDEIIIAYRWDMPTQEILNPTASRIFKLCDGEHNIGQIARILSKEFEFPDRKKVLRDVTNCIQTLTSERLIKINNFTANREKKRKTYIEI